MSQDNWYCEVNNDLDSISQGQPFRTLWMLLCPVSTLQLWMLQCRWHCQPFSYGCFSVSDTVNPSAMDASVSVTLSTLQLWMFQCHWHCQRFSYGCSSVSDTGASIAKGLIETSATFMPSSLQWPVPQIFFPSGHCPETATNTHVSTSFR